MTRVVVAGDMKQISGRMMLESQAGMTALGRRWSITSDRYRPEADLIPLPQDETG